jgi:hypothetical protein
LPAHAWTYQVGVMGARTPAPVRIQFRSLSRQEFLTFLRRIGWGGSIAELDALATELARFTDDITFAIDLLEHGLGRKIGLECYIRDDMAQMDGRWPIFLDHLVTRGWCLGAKRDALLAYPGISQPPADAAAWPSNLNRTVALFGNHAVPVLTRYLHHVKIVFQDAQHIEAKAYIGIAQRWVARAA